MSPCDFLTLVETTTENSDLNTVFGMPTWLCWVVIGICLLISGLFSASENSFSNCNKYHFKVLANEGNFTAKIIVKLVEKFDNTLITVLIANNIVQTFMSFLSAMLFYNLCEIYGLGSGVEAVLSTVVMALLVYVVSDTVPKIVSKEIPNRMVYVLCYTVFIMGIILYPIGIIFKGILTLVHKIFKIKDENILTKEDFIMSADEAINDENADEEDKDEEQEDLFEPNELRMLNRAFNFDMISAKDVLTPLDKMFALDINGLTVQKLNDVILKTTYSRIPIYDETIDDIIGILTVKTYFREVTLDPHLEIRSVLNQPLYIEENMKVDDIFKMFNREKTHIAIVKKDNKVIGMVTMEDVLEELVGNISENRVNLIGEKK